MKMKFHLGKRNSPRHSHSSQQGNGPVQAVALIDERFLKWLAGQHASAPLQLQRRNLVPVLSDLLRQSATEAQLQRAYLYSDQQTPELIDDVVLRSVPQHSVDGGLGLVRALGYELNQIAQHGGNSLVLIVSDDERLIPYIDEAQWRGLKVALVCDEASLDVNRLMKEDPSWARLLLQADRRLALGVKAWDAMSNPDFVMAPGRQYLPAAQQPQAEREGEAGDSQGQFGHAAPTGEWLDQVRQVIEAWWSEETPHARLDLHDEMQNSQGVPPETDRHLLLRVRRELARTLSFQEKKAMRELIRATVLAHPPALQEAAPAES
ncbi:MAG: hypothetical protein RLZZ555_1339 [Pseudomonadota bacterium]|jgi:hypothetical protein